jgi:hypothetical protein
MEILKKVYYLYLLIGGFFIFDGITKFSENQPRYWMSFLLAAAAIFMFFFRKKFSKRMEKRNKQI